MAVTIVMATVGTNTWIQQTVQTKKKRRFVHLFACLLYTCALVSDVHCNMRCQVEKVGLVARRDPKESPMVHPASFPWQPISTSSTSAVLGRRQHDAQMMTFSCQTSHVHLVAGGSGAHSCAG